MLDKYIEDYDEDSDYDEFDKDEIEEYTPNPNFVDTGDRGATILECPECQMSTSIQMWNESIEVSNVYRVTKATSIPEDIDKEEYSEWAANHGGVTECPQCGYPMPLVDLNAY